MAFPKKARPCQFLILLLLFTKFFDYFPLVLRIIMKFSKKKNTSMSISNIFIVISKNFWSFSKIF